MKKLTDEEVEEAYDELFRDRPDVETRDRISDEEVEEAAEALFKGRNPYRRGGPFSARGREERIREMKEQRENARPLDDATIADAVESLFV